MIEPLTFDSNAWLEQYLTFLKGKIEIAVDSGFEISDEDIHPILKPHQRDSVKWAIRGGCRALFEQFGLGKSIIQLEICRIITKVLGGRAMIVCPLDVRLEFEYDARTLLGIEVKYVRNMAEINDCDNAILITNYERVRDGDIDPNFAIVACLDEAAVLRSYGSKTYQEFLPLFKSVQYRFVATAVPSPNRLKELIHYAGYLGIMDTGQALTRFFQRDSTKANNLTLYPHKEDEFWLWVSTWALFVSKPSDLGHSNEGYDLPELNIRYHEVQVDHSGAGNEKNGQGKLYRDAAVSLPAAAKEKRDSLGVRVSKALEIINEQPDDHYLIWHDLDNERDEIKCVIPDVKTLTGSQNTEERVQTLYDFAHGHIPRMATKKSISACGGNLQRHCHRAIFIGIDHKFHDFIQAIHRLHRFGQPATVRIDVIYTESERMILEDLQRKWTLHNDTAEKMSAIIQKYGLTATAKEAVLQRHIGLTRMEVTGERFVTVNNDCVYELARMAENSIDLVHTSIPFANHYEYTPSYNDFGHTSGNDHFWAQMDFATPLVFRALKPGRIAAIHVKDRILFGNTTGDGMPTCDSFHEETSFHFQKHGFKKIGMIHIDTDVVRENNQTYRLGWTEQCKDGSKMGVGCPEYVLLFRKPQTDKTKAYADVPVVKPKGKTEYICPKCSFTAGSLAVFHVLEAENDDYDHDPVEWACPGCNATFITSDPIIKHVTPDEYPCSRWQIDAHAHWRSSGDRMLSPDEIAALPLDGGILQRAWRKRSLETVYDYDEHILFVKKLEDMDKMPKVFMIAPPGTLREDIWDDINRMLTLNTTQSQKGRQMHVCPLQLDIIKRIIERYSNPGEVVLDFFGGIASVGKKAIDMGRRAYMIELNSDYFRDGLGYLQLAEEEVSMPTLFSLMEAP